MLAAQPRIGWIGVGRMGFALAERLLDAGHDVAVYNRTRAKADPLGERGAKIVDSPVDLADRDVVFIMVSAPADLAAGHHWRERAVDRPGHRAARHRRLVDRVHRSFGGAAGCG